MVRQFDATECNYLAAQLARADVVGVLIASVVLGTVGFGLWSLPWAQWI